MHRDIVIVTSTHVLGMLSTPSYALGAYISDIANQNARHVPFAELYNSALNEQLRPERDFEMWKKGAGYVHISLNRLICM